jgi:hypothetical protein
MIQPGLPSIQRCEIKGTLEEGSLLSLEMNYFGGTEGSTEILWYKRKRGATKEEMERWNPIYQEDLDLQEIVGNSSSSSNSHHHEGNHNNKTYCPTIEDIGFFIFVAITPQRSDGVFGKTKYVVSSSSIQPATPQIRNLCIIGEPQEGHELIAKYQYYGGEEGNSKFAWYRGTTNLHSPSNYKLIPMSLGKRVYFPTREDVGKTLTFVFTPIRNDGMEGETKEVTTQVIQQGLPSVTGVAINILDPLDEFPTLEGVGQYRGGEEGESEFQWQKVFADGTTEIIDHPLQYFTIPSKFDKNCGIRFG